MKLFKKIVIMIAVVISISTSLVACTKKSYTITWKNYDGAVLETDAKVKKGVIPTYDGNTPTRVSTSELSYSFSGWDPVVAKVSSDAVYTAKFTSTPIIVENIYYTITWKNYNGDVLEVDTNVLSGTTPVFDGLEPTRAITDSTIYTFSGWTPSVVPAISNATYTAQYSEQVRQYSITWLNYDGSVLKVDSVNYGSSPLYSGSTPTKPGTPQYSYEFTGWSPTIVNVTGDATYTAEFTRSINSYTITWLNWDSTVLKVDIVNYGVTPSYEGTPTKEGNSQYTYTFKEWSPVVSPVTSNATYTATYNQIVNQYTITWLNWDDTLLGSEQVAFGTTPTYKGSSPTKESDGSFTYEFKEWSPAIVSVTTNATYKAVFEAKEIVIIPDTYTVTWKNYDGSTIKTDSNVVEETLPVYVGATPTRSASASTTYVFSGWTPTIVNVVADAVYTATYSESVNQYTITWNNYNGDLLKTTLVNYGATPVYDGATPTRTGNAEYSYSHSGWTPTIVSVVGNATYTATFTGSVNQYTITWKNYDNSILGTDLVGYGSTPSYSGDTPIKPATVEFSYSFTGWSPAVTSVVGDATYIAQFGTSTNKYLITFENYNGEQLQSSEVTYGTLPSYTGSTPVKPDTLENSYVFSGWTPTIVNVIGAATYTATFTETPRLYTITFDTQGGSYIAPQVGHYGDALIRPADPTKEGYSFVDWYIDAAGYYLASLGGTITGNATVYAKWALVEVITFNYELQEDDTYYVTGVNGTPINITIPSTYNGKAVTGIKEQAFHYKSTLASVVLPNSVQVIDFAAFGFCSNLTTITLGTGLKTIGARAFEGCSKLVSLTLPNGLLSIGGFAFSTCYALTNITIPSSVTKIGWAAFYGCSNITTTIDGVDYIDTWAVAYDFTLPITENIVVRAGTAGIADNAMNYNTGTYILTISLPSTLKYIGNNAFQGQWLNTLTLNNGLLTIGDSAFADTNVFTSVTFPNSLTSIGKRAFSGSYNLTTITFGTGTLSIGDYAFERLRYLTSVTIPANVVSIGDGNFQNCGTLTSITVSGGTSFKTVSNVLFSYDGTRLIAYPSGLTSTSYTVPAGVKYIGASAFRTNTKLTSISFTTTVLESIGDYAFENCYNIVGALNLPSSLITIGADAFYGCSKLTSINLGANVSSIGIRAFSGCSLVTSISVNSSNTNYKTVGGVLFNYDQTTLIAYPIGNTVTTYVIPGTVTSIEAYAFTSCTYLTSITINSNILTIGEYAFGYCSNLTITVNLKESEIPSGWSSSWNTNVLATIWLPE